MKMAWPPGPEGNKKVGTTGVILPILLVHLMSLSSYDKDKVQQLGPAALTDSPTDPHALQLPTREQGTAGGSVATNVAVSCNPFFERDATDLLRWMRHALENLHMDTLVVTSAATLALRYARLHAPEGLARRRPNNLSSTNKSKRRKPGEKGRPEGRRKQGVTAYLLSFTTLHLASKYHEVYEKQLEDLGITVAPTKIYKLGLEISLCSSMGAALNASFRANPLTFQSLFCDMTNQTAIVRMCSEWFALCLSLVSPAQHGDEDERREISSPTPQQHQAPHYKPPLVAFSPVSPAATAPLTRASSISTPATSGFFCTDLGGKKHTQQIQICRRSDSDSWAGLTREAGLAIGAVVLARRLSRSPGPCLPVDLRSAVGLKNDEDALRLVAQGIRVARKALDIESGEENGADSTDSDSKTSGPGRFLAGELVFDRTIDAPDVCNDFMTADRETTATKRATLLTLLTTEYDYRRLAETARNDRDFKTEQGSSLSARARHSSPPSGFDATPIGDNYSEECQGPIRPKAFPLWKCWRKQRSPDDNPGADRNNLTYSSSSRDTSIAHQGRDMSPGTNSSQGVMKMILADYMPEEPSSEDYCTLSALRPSSFDPSFDAQQGRALDKHLQTPMEQEGSDGSDSPPSFNYEATVRAAAECLLDTGTGSSPPLPHQRPPPRLQSPSVAASAMHDPILTALDAVEKIRPENTQKNLGKRSSTDGWSSTEDGRKEPSTQVTLRCCERTNTKLGIEQDGQAARCRTLRRSSPPIRTLEQERLDRWDLLANKILAALEDGCGCSFCKLGTELVTRGKMDRQCDEEIHTITDQSTFAGSVLAASISSSERTNTRRPNNEVMEIVVPLSNAMGIAEAGTAAATTTEITTSKMAESVEARDSVVLTDRQPQKDARLDSVSDVLVTSGTQRLAETGNVMAEFIEGTRVLT